MQARSSCTFFTCAFFFNSLNTVLFSESGRACRKEDLERDDHSTTSTQELLSRADRTFNIFIFQGVPLPVNKSTITTSFQL